MAKIYVPRFLPNPRALSLHAAVMLFGLMSPSAASAHLRALYDPICDAMVAEPPEFPELSAPSSPRYFNKIIPKSLILVDLCGPDAVAETWLNPWRDFAARHRYAVRQVTGWSEAAHLDGSTAPFVALAQQLDGLGDCKSAEKVLRWAMLANHGGIVVDRRMAAPASRGAEDAFNMLAELRGLVVLTAHKPQNLRPWVSGVTVTDSLILACDHHPVLTKLLRQLPNNIASVVARAPHADSSYRAGHVLLTRVLNGAYTILPRSFTTQMPEDLDAY